MLLSFLVTVDDTGHNILMLTTVIITMNNEIMNKVKKKINERREIYIIIEPDILFMCIYVCVWGRKGKKNNRNKWTNETNWTIDWMDGWIELNDFFEYNCENMVRLFCKKKARCDKSWKRERERERESNTTTQLRMYLYVCDVCVYSMVSSGPIGSSWLVCHVSISFNVY